MDVPSLNGSGSRGGGDGTCGGFGAAGTGSQICGWCVRGCSRGPSPNLIQTPPQSLQRSNTSRSTIGIARGRQKWCVPEPASKYPYRALRSTGSPQAGQFISADSAGGHSSESRGLGALACRAARIAHRSAQAWFCRAFALRWRTWPGDRPQPYGTAGKAECSRPSRQRSPPPASRAPPRSRSDSFSFPGHGSGYATQSDRRRSERTVSLR